MNSGCYANIEDAAIEYLVTIALRHSGNAAEADALLDTFLAAHANASPVVGEDLKARTIDVTFAVDARDGYEAFERGRNLFTAATADGVVPVTPSEEARTSNVVGDCGGCGALRRRANRPFSSRAPRPAWHGNAITETALAHASWRRDANQDLGNMAREHLPSFVAVRPTSLRRFAGTSSMEPTGIEPVTSCLQSRRSPS